MPDFDDLLEANRQYSDAFDHPGLEAPADARVAVVTCMDSRIDPLAMLGLSLGDAKVLRNPGGQVTDDVLTSLVLAVALLNVDRIMVIEHTRCAMASNSEDQLKASVAEATGGDPDAIIFGAISDQSEAIRADVAKVTAHPLIGDHVAVAGFLYDVDTGLLAPVA